MNFNEAQVWQWLNSKKYGGKLNTEAWEFIDGPTLLKLNVESAMALEVPTILIPRLLKDIKSLHKKLDTLTTLPGKNPSYINGCNISTLAENRETIKSMTTRLSNAQESQLLRAYNEEFAGSWIRIGLLMMVTYVVLSLYMNLVQVDRPWVNAVVPTVGYQLSTLHLPCFNHFYVKRRLHRSRKINPTGNQ